MNDAADVQLAQHRHRYLAGEGAMVASCMFWAYTATREPSALSTIACERRERRADRDLDAVEARDARQQRLDKRSASRRSCSSSSCPRPAGHGSSLRLSSAATPGSMRPSISSSVAPPPVETCVTRPVRPNVASAATESPPPTTVVPGHAATASATVRVPCSNAAPRTPPSARSKRPCRQRASAPRSAQRCADRCRVPSSHRAPRRRRCRGARRPSRRARRSRDRPAASALRTRPRSSAPRAASRPSSSQSEAPTEWPCTLKNGKHIAPPINTASASSKNAIDDADLVGHLGAAEHRDERPRRLLEDRAQHLDLALEEKPRRRRARRGG